MKNLTILYLLLCNFENIKAQTPEFLLPLYFNDDKGNKDTIYSGYDINAKFGFSDGDFGEKDIRNEPFEKQIETRVGSFKQAFNPNLPYMSKRFVERRSCFNSTSSLSKGVNTLTLVYFLAKNFPVTISWDSSLIDKNCTYNSFFHRKTLSKGVYDFPKERIYLRKNAGKITLSKSFLKSIPFLATGDIILGNGDTLYCMILYLLDKDKQAYEWNVATNEVSDDNHIVISPNPTYDFINIRITDDQRQMQKLEIIDVAGNIKYEKNLQNINNFDADISTFSRGLFFVKLTYEDSKIVFKRFIKL